MKRRSKRKTGETDTSVISTDEKTGEIITSQIKNGKRVVVHIVDEKGEEVMPSYAWSAGIDIHRKFGQVTVLVRNDGRIRPETYSWRSVLINMKTVLFESYR